MRSEDLRDAALVLIAHGSTLNEDSAAPAYQHGDYLRRTAGFGEVTEAFWKQEPPVWSILRGVFSPRVFLVPLFISAGWFTEKVIPGAIGLRGLEDDTFSRVQVRGGQTLHYCSPVGSHDAMTDVLMARARDAVERHPFPRAPKASETTLFIAGHGTSYSRGSRESIERQVSRVREVGGYADVQPVFLEEAPTVEECWARASTRNVILVPFFISDGLHTREDIPRMLGEPEATVRGRLAAGQPTWRNPTERHGKRLWLGGAVGTEPLLADVIMERVREMAGASAPGGGQRRSRDSTGA